MMILRAIGSVLLGALFPGLLALAPAGATAPAEVVAHVYDTSSYSQPTTDTASDRGPPAIVYDHAALFIEPAQSCSTSFSTFGCPLNAAAATPPGRIFKGGLAGGTFVWRALRGLFRNGDEVATGAKAANGGERLLWTSWQNYPKVTQGGREYAQIGDRLYGHHAVDRLHPSGLGAPAGATGAGRSISPNFVEDVLGSTKGVPVKGPNGEARLSFTSGTVQVITENNIVITVITR